MKNIDDLIGEFEIASNLDKQIDSIIFRLNAIKNGKQLMFKQNDYFVNWVPNYNNPNNLLEGNLEMPSIINMNVEWTIKG